MATVIPTATLVLTEPQPCIVLQLFKYWRETEGAFTLVENQQRRGHGLPAKNIDLNPKEFADTEKVLLKALLDIDI